MKRLEISRTGNDDLTENRKRQLEDALSILAGMVIKTVLREKSLLERDHRKNTVMRQYTPTRSVQWENLMNP